jgi:hypothetical protein
MARLPFQVAAVFDLPPFVAAVGPTAVSNGGPWLFLPMLNPTIYFRKIEEN